MIGLAAGLDEGILSLSLPVLVHMYNLCSDNTTINDSAPSSVHRPPQSRATKTRRIRIRRTRRTPTAPRAAAGP